MNAYEYMSRIVAIEEEIRALREYINYSSTTYDKRVRAQKQIRDLNIELSKNSSQLIKK